MIYFVTEPKTRLTKIGIASTDVERRVQNIQTGNPRKLEIVETFSVYGNDYEVERLIHRSLEKQGLRVHGEWFIITWYALLIIEGILLDYNSRTPQYKFNRLQRRCVSSFIRRLIFKI